MKVGGRELRRKGKKKEGLIKMNEEKTVNHKSGIIKQFIGRGLGDGGGGGSE